MSSWPENGSDFEPVQNRDREVSPAERIEDYLDHLCVPLVGVVPYRERRSMRQEAAAHIACLVDEFQAERGCTSDEAG
jgi:hypothetical protein